MKNISSILVLALTCLSVSVNFCIAQDNTTVLSSPDNCLPAINFSSSRQYPDEANSINLSVKWRVRLADNSETFDRDIRPLIKNNLVFTPFSKGFAINLISGQKVPFGSGQIKQMFRDKANQLMVIDALDSSYLIDVLTKRKINTFLLDAERDIKFIDGPIYLSPSSRGVNAYSTSGKEILWSFKDRMASFYKIIPYSDGFFTLRDYYHSKKDSIAISVLYFNSKGTIVKRLDFLKEFPTEIIVDNDILKVYSNSEIYAVDIKNWKIIWCRREVLNQSFVTTESRMISPKMILDKKTGIVIKQSNLDLRPHEISFWNGYLITEAFDGDARQNFLIKADYSKIYSIKYPNEQLIKECAGDWEDFYLFAFAKYSYTDITVGILRCRDGIYLYGFQMDEQLTSDKVGN